LETSTSDHLLPQVTFLIALDRDGTIIVDMDYLSDPDKVAILPFVAEGIRRFNRTGIKVIVISNQSGVGRGYFDLEALNRTDARMNEQLEQQGAHIDAAYYCVHSPEAGCTCRKPKVGLLQQAERDFHSENWLGIIGDSPVDIALARARGVCAIRVTTGRSDYPVDADPGDLICASISEAADAILQLVANRNTGL